MKRIGTIAACTMIALALTAGCGGEDPTSSADYCDHVADLMDLRTEMSDPGKITLDDLRRAADASEAATSAAPEEIRDNWQRSSENLRDYVTSLEEAGAEGDQTITDLMGDPEGRKAVMAAAKSASELRDDNKVIAQSASDECNIDLPGA